MRPAAPIPFHETIKANRALRVTARAVRASSAHLLSQSKDIWDTFDRNRTIWVRERQVRVPTSRIGVLALDDYDMIGGTLERALAAEPGIRWLGCLSESREVEAAVRELTPDVLLMDYEMPGGKAYDLLRRLADREYEGAAGRTLKIVMLTSHPDSRTTQRCIEAGAHGCIFKDAHPGAIAAAVIKAAKGIYVVSRASGVGFALGN
jgi:CheY-like chemotaxis protein